MIARYVLASLLGLMLTGMLVLGCAQVFKWFHGLPWYGEYPLTGLVAALVAWSGAPLGKGLRAILIDQEE